MTPSTQAKLERLVKRVADTAFHAGTQYSSKQTLLEAAEELARQNLLQFIADNFVEKEKSE